MSNKIDDYLGEALGDDEPELDMKELDSAEDYQSREDWARKNLYWDEDRKMWEIPGTDYSTVFLGTVEHANHLFMLRTFPWLEQDGSELSYRLFLEPEKLDWMPLWNPFRGYVKRAICGSVIDDDTMSEVAEQAVERTWKDTYAKEFAESLLERFGGEFKAANPRAEIEHFLFGPRGLQFFNQMAFKADESWDTDLSHKPSISVDRVADVVTWLKLRDAMYPDRNQLKFSLGDRPREEQLGMFEAALGDDDEEEDMLSDVIRSSKIANPEVMLAWLKENLNGQDGFYTLAAYSDFSGGLVDRANAAYFRRKYPWLTSYKRGFGGEDVGIHGADVANIPPDQFEALKADYLSLEDYPLLDEEGHTELEIEKRQEAWNGWIKRDYFKELRVRFPAFEEAFDEFEDQDNALGLFEDARDRAGEEWDEDTGGDQSIHVDKVIDATTENMLWKWMFPENDQNQLRLELESLCEGREYSCLLADAPDNLADAVIKWGQMYVMDDEVYTGDHSDRYGREADPHVTCKYGLHETQPSGELLRIIEETQPFEIEVMGCSLFESSPDYDVLKLDVESEALRQLNARLSQLPNSDEHDTYNPHLTVCYITKGTCRELVGKRLLAEPTAADLRFLVKSVVFSPPAGEKIRLFLGKPNSCAYLAGLSTHGCPLRSSS